VKEHIRGVQMGEICYVRPIAGYKKEHPKPNENALKELSREVKRGQ
jgi:hypothetical protein